MNRRTILLGIFLVISLGAFLHRTISEIEQPKNLRFGSLIEPLGDSLSGAQGALSFLLRESSPAHLQHPTVGIFFSSIATGFNSLQNIPYVLAALLILSALLCGLALPRSCTLALSLAFLICGYTSIFDLSFAPSFISTYLPNFTAFVFSLSALLLLTSSLSRPGAVGVPFCIAFLLLGVSAAISGPMLISGPFLFILVHVLYLNKMRLWATALALLAFLVPPVANLLLQDSALLTARTVSQLYCIAGSPFHVWNEQCYKNFLYQRLDFDLVLADYLQFLASAEGLQVIASKGSEHLYQASRMLTSLYFLAAMGVALCLELAISARENEYVRFSVRKVITLPLFWVALQIIAPMVSAHSGLNLESCSASVVALAVLFLMFFAYQRDTPLTWICLVVYTISVAFSSLLALPYLGAASGCYTFLLILGTLSSVLEEPLEREAPAAWASARGLQAAVCLVAVIGLYCGNFIFNTAPKETYRAEVNERRAAIKVSDSPATKRSLYYGGKGEIFYTEKDSLPIWGTKTFSKLAPPLAPDGISQTIVKMVP